MHIENSLGEIYWRQDNCKQARIAYAEALRMSAQLHLEDVQGCSSARFGSIG